MVKGDDKVSARLESGTADVYPVPFEDFVIVRRIAETEGEYSLLLEVGLMDPGETLGNHRLDAQETSFHRSVFAAASLSVIVYGDHDAACSRIPVGPGGLPDFHPGALAEKKAFCR